MDSINKVELQGYIGTIRVSTANGTKVANFSLATDLIIKSKDGEPRNETTWHNIVAWQNKGIANLDNLRKGTLVHITGRMRNNRYTKDGEERIFNEIYAVTMDVIKEAQPKDSVHTYTTELPNIPMN